MIVEPYNPEWPRMFLQLQTFIYRNLIGTYHAVEHVGSTAVPGMAAKPIIDIDIVMHDGRFEAIKKRLLAAGNEYRGDQGVPGRESFRLTDPGLRQALPEHHLYALTEDAEELSRHRAFRDFLIANPQWREKLSTHKLGIASGLGDSRNDREAYQEQRSRWLEILALATAKAPA